MEVLWIGYENNPFFHNEADVKSENYECTFLEAEIKKPE